MNLKGLRKVKDKHAFYKPANDSKEYTSPFTIITSFSIGLFPRAKRYERQVYEFMSFLGDIGGLADAIIFFGLVMSKLLTTEWVRCVTAEAFNNILQQEYGLKKEMLDSDQDDDDELQFPTHFRLKLFCFEKLCCLSRCIRRDAETNFIVNVPKSCSNCFNQRF